MLSLAVAHMRTASHALWALLCLVAGSPTAAAGATISAQVTWQPSTSSGVVGYRIYTRLLSSIYGAPQDAGLPTPAPNGSLTFVITGLDATTDYAFAVTAYATDGTESGFSNELTLSATTPTTTLPTTTTSSSTTTTTPPPSSTTSSTTTTTAPPFTTTSSSTTTSTIRRHHHKTAATRQSTASSVALDGGTSSCTLRSDGSPCYPGDPCENGECRTSTCVAARSPIGGNRFLDVGRFRLRALGTRGRLVAQGSFSPATVIDPTASGATVEVRAQADGDLVYRATVPGWAFHPDRSGRSFHYAVPRAGMPAGSEGLKSLALRFDGQTMSVRVRATVSGSVSRLAPTRLAWMVQLGEECVRNVNLVCAATPDGGTGCD